MENEQVNKIENFVKFIVEELVDNKQDVSIKTMAESENDFKIFVNVNDNDMGRVIGKNGKIANSIRAMVKTLSANTGNRYYVKIGEKEE